MSTIEANTLKPISGSSTLTLGESGDTVSLGSGVTGGTGFGVSDGSVTMAKLSTSATESDNVEKRVGKVWVRFNGTGTPAILDDFNVSSISDLGTGQYRANFSTALADANYAAVSDGVKGSYGSGSRVNDLTASTCSIDVWSTSAYIDAANVTLIILGNS